MPIARNCSTSADMEAWYPPGHGDFYESFYNSGLLEDFIKQVITILISFSHLKNVLEIVTIFSISWLDN